MIQGIDSKNDYAFKKLFGSESNAVLLIDCLQIRAIENAVEVLEA
jgi:hypothetical protein